ncbi:hypothetical protein [Mycobacterium sp.]|uniref:hypothetical protein n=1 Tax=Mycobacterium sp. TaxID=1785 RepID=UPI0025CD8F9F|nr:hypothetical protein [Mycobacterium sp.]
MLAWSPAVLLRWCRRHPVVMVLLVAGFGLVVCGAAVAGADDGTGSSTGGGDVVISWMGIKDSAGVPVAKYTLTLNQGGWDDPIHTAWATLVSLAYEIYLCVTTFGLWLIKFVLGFEWLNLFTGPFAAIGRGVDDAMNEFGLAPMTLAVLAIVAVATVLAGRIAKAVSNLAMGLLMVGIAGTIFAHPLAELVGQDGVLAKGRDTGLQIGALLEGGHKINVDDMVSQLADRFLRQPTQMINFGEVSDSVSRTCRDAWTKGVTAGHDDKLKDDIAGCDKVKGPAMHQKSMGNPAAAFVPVWMCTVLSVILVGFAGYFVWHVVRSAVQAMLYASLAPPAFAIGVIPGGTQTFAWKTLLDCVMAFTAMVIYTAALGGYKVILDEVFKEHNAYKAIFLTALVLVFGFAFFAPLRRVLDRSRDTVAARLSGTTAGGAGRGWVRNAASTRAKVAVARQFGWGNDRDDPDTDDSRPPARIDSESDSRAGGYGSPRVVKVPGQVTVTMVSGPHSGGYVGGSAPGGRENGTAATASTEPGTEVSTSGRNRERLAEAIRLARAARRGGRETGGGADRRHALNEAA